MYVLLDMSWEDIKEEAEDMMFPVKMIQHSAKVPFTTKMKDNEVVPFLIKDKQEIIIRKFDKLFSINDLTKNKVLLKIFPLHNFKELNKVETSR